VGLDEYVVPITAIVTMTLINVWIVTSVIGRALDRANASLNASMTRVQTQIGAAGPGGSTATGDGGAES